MSQNMDDPQFKQECAKIWSDYAPHTTIDSFNGSIALHEKSTFLGYADVTLGIKTASGHTSQWKLRGLEVKLLGGKPHLDMPQEKGSNGKWYPKFFPKSAADRVVITALVFSDSRVIAAIEQAAVEAAAKAEPESAASSDEGVEGAVGAQVDNPFNE